MKNTSFSFSFSYANMYVNAMAPLATSFQKAERVRSQKLISSNSEIQQRLLGLVLINWITNIDLFYKMKLK